MKCLAEMQPSQIHKSRAHEIGQLISQQLFGVVDDYVELLNDQLAAISVRRAAAFGLAQIGGDDAEQYLIEALGRLRDSDPRLIGSIASHLAEIGGPAALQSIAEHGSHCDAALASALDFAQDLLRHKLGLQLDEANTVGPPEQIQPEICDIAGYTGVTHRPASRVEIFQCMQNLGSASYGLREQSFDAFLLDPNGHQTMIIFRRERGCQPDTSVPGMLGLLVEYDELEDEYELYGVITSTPGKETAIARLRFATGELSHVGQALGHGDQHRLTLSPIRQAGVMPISIEAVVRADGAWMLMQVDEGLAAARKVLAKTLTVDV